MQLQRYTNLIKKKTHFGPKIPSATHSSSFYLFHLFFYGSELSLPHSKATITRKTNSIDWEEAFSTVFPKDYISVSLEVLMQLINNSINYTIQSTWSFLQVFMERAEVGFWNNSPLWGVAAWAVDAVLPLCSCNCPAPTDELCVSGGVRPGGVGALIGGLDGGCVWYGE